MMGDDAWGANHATSLEVFFEATLGSTFDPP